MKKDDNNILGNGFNSPKNHKPSRPTSFQTSGLPPKIILGVFLQNEFKPNENDLTQKTRETKSPNNFSNMRFPAKNLTFSLEVAGTASGVVSCSG